MMKKTLSNIMTYVSRNLPCVEQPKPEELMDVVLVLDDKKGTLPAVLCLDEAGIKDAKEIVQRAVNRGSSVVYKGLSPQDAFNVECELNTARLDQATLGGRLPDDTVSQAANEMYFFSTSIQKKCE